MQLNTIVNYITLFINIIHSNKYIYNNKYNFI